MTETYVHNWISHLIVYGWSTDNFPASEAQSPYSIPLVYSKGPAAQIVFTVIDTSKGTGILKKLFI